MAAASRSSVAATRARGNAPRRGIAGRSKRSPVGGLRRQRYNVQVQASAPDEVQAMSPPPEDELICLVKAEIPEQLPRPYLIKDLYQWSCINLQDNGREQYGLPLAVVPYEEEGGEVSLGFVVSFMRRLETGDEESAVDMYVRFDNEQIGVFDYVHKNDEGRPELQYSQGKTTQGKYLEWMRRKDQEIPAEMLPTVKQVLKDMNGAIQTYYTFGSCFCDDST